MKDYERNGLRYDTWLTKLLWIVASKQGGEVRLDADELETAPSKLALLIDFDAKQRQLVIRACAGTSDLIVVDTQQQWARSEKESRANRETYSEPSPEPRPIPMNNGGGRRVNHGISEADLAAIDEARGHVPSEEFLANVERGLLNRALERQEQKNRSSVQRRRQMPRAVPDTS